MKKIVFCLTIWALISGSHPACSQSRECTTIVAEALNAYRVGDLAKARSFAKRGIDLCRDQAIEQQKQLQKGGCAGCKVWIASSDASAMNDPRLPKDVEGGRIVSLGWKELNAIGAAYFIRAEIYRGGGKLQEARKEYQDMISQYPDAYQQGYQGWFWKLSEVAQDAIDVLGTKYDYGDYKADSLIKKGWEAFYKKDYKGARLYANKCLKLYDAPDQNFKSDVAVAHFLLGKVNLINNELELARSEFKKVVGNYPVAIYPNIKNYPHFNNITRQARDYLLLIGTPYDFGNYSSETLTIKAWKSWDQGDFKGVELYANKCIELWGLQAREMQKQMKEFAKGSFIPYFWAVNDVGTCHFILGMAYQKERKIAKARHMYETVIKDYAYAQCWDPKGHYWKVAEVSLMNLAAIDKTHP